MSVVVIDVYGKPLYSLSEGLLHTGLVLLPNESLVAGMPDDGQKYGYVTSKGWVALPPQPSPSHEFNYSLWKWMSHKTLKEAQANQWENIKWERDSYINEGFWYNGNLYDSDPDSQSRIHLAASVGKARTWVTKDNQKVDLSSEDLTNLREALVDFLDSIFVSSQLAREAIEAASTIEEVDSITLGEFQ